MEPSLTGDCHNIISLETRGFHEDHLEYFCVQISGVSPTGIGGCRAQPKAGSTVDSSAYLQGPVDS